jgi:alpha,alpha-trehalose phosphorylase
LVDGKPRREGVRSFLAARGLSLPEGSAADAPGAETVHGLARRKDQLFEQRLQLEGIEVFATTLALIEALRARGIKIGIVTSSRHGREILDAARLARLFDARLDGIDMDELGLKGKPDPDMFTRCAKALGVAPGRAVVVEDAIAGVQAARRGGFGLVVGVDRGGNREALAQSGADVVVRDLEELDPAALEARFRARQEEISWRIEQEGFEPAREHEMESLFC